MGSDIAIVKITSTLAIVIPIFYNARVFRTAGLEFRLFLGFLLCGLFNDLLGWTNYYYSTTHPGERNVALSNLILYASIIYSIIEATFFVWIVTKQLNSKFFTNVRNVVFITILAWTFFAITRGSSVQGDISQSTLFDVYYEVIISFLAGLAMLRFAEGETEMMQIPMFWTITGIFFYCFSTFFIFMVKLVVTDTIADQLWLVHDVANITTYCFYCVAFSKMYQSNSAPPLITKKD